jgi:hypothetical protein
MTFLSSSTLLSPRRRPATRGVSAAAILLALLLASGCGDDDPAPPPPSDGRIDFPGDAATLQLAIDMAVGGDSVFVGAGTHVMDEGLLFSATQSGVTLVGRRDGEQTKSLADRPVLVFSDNVDAITVPPAAANVTIRGLTIQGDFITGVKLRGAGGHLADCRIESAGAYSVACTTPDSTVVEGNLLLDAGLFGVNCATGARTSIVGNTISGAGDCGIISNNAEPACERNIVVGSANWGIACFGIPLPTALCNAFYSNGIDSTWDLSDECLPPDSGSFHADPLFCDVISYALSPNSPCTADSAGACGQIGAVGVGCAAQ